MPCSAAAWRDTGCGSCRNRTGASTGRLRRSHKTGQPTLRSLVAYDHWLQACRLAELAADFGPETEQLVADLLRRLGA